MTTRTQLPAVISSAERNVSAAASPPASSTVSEGPSSAPTSRGSSRPLPSASNSKWGSLRQLPWFLLTKNRRRVRLAATQVPRLDCGTASALHPNRSSWCRSQRPMLVGSPPFRSSIGSLGGRWLTPSSSGRSKRCVQPDPNASSRTWEPRPVRSRSAGVTASSMRPPLSERIVGSGSCHTGAPGGGCTVRVPRSSGRRHSSWGHRLTPRLPKTGVRSADVVAPSGGTGLRLTDAARHIASVLPAGHFEEVKPELSLHRPLDRADRGREDDLVKFLDHLARSESSEVTTLAPRRTRGVLPGKLSEIRPGLDLRLQVRRLVLTGDQDVTGGSPSHLLHPFDYTSTSPRVRAGAFQLVANTAPTCPPRELRGPLPATKAVATNRPGYGEWQPDGGAAWAHPSHREADLAVHPAGALA